MRKKVKHLTNLLRFNRGVKVPIIGPLKAEWEVINFCNAKCQTCLHWQRKPDKAVLSTAEGKDLIRQLSNGGVVNLSFTGGEPLLRKDIVELISYAKGEGFFTSLVSNGLLITERRARELVDAGLDSIFISIDAANAKLNDEIRGIPGYFELANSAIDNLKSMRRNSSPKIFIKSTITTKNIKQLVPLAALCDSKGIEGFTFQLAQILKHNDFKFDESFLVEDRNYDILIEQMDKVIKEYGKALNGSVMYYNVLRHFLQKDSSFRPYHNVSGFSFTYIDSVGNVYTSPSKNYRLGNIRNDSFEKIWFCQEANDLRMNGKLVNNTDYLFNSIGSMSINLSDLSPKRIFQIIRPAFNGEDFN